MPHCVFDAYLPATFVDSPFYGRHPASFIDMLSRGMAVNFELFEDSDDNFLVDIKNFIVLYNFNEITSAIFKLSFLCPQAERIVDWDWGGVLIM